MPLQIRPTPDARAIALVGELDAATVPDLDDHTAALVAAAGEALVLDVSALNYLDSAGIRALLRLENDLKARDGRLLLRDVTPRLRRVLRYSGLEDRFGLEGAAAPAEGA